VANFVRSAVEKVKQRFASRPVGRRAKSAFPPSFRRWWATVPSYLPFYILAPVLAYALWYGLQPATVIAPFHLPQENKENPLPFSGEAAADVLQDALTSIEQEAKGQAMPPPCDFWEEKEAEASGSIEVHSGGRELFLVVLPLKSETSVSFEVRGPVSTEVKGISPEAVISAAREVFGKERYISGDVVLKAPHSFQLMARAKDRGPWTTKPQEISLPGLQYASCELAERILGATNKNVLAAAWIRRENYGDVIKLYADVPSKNGDPRGLNNVSVAHVGLGNTLAGKGQYDEAIAEYRKAIALKSDLPQAHNGLGTAFLKKGLDDEAKAEYRKAIELKPNDAEAHNNLGNALFVQLQIDAAIAEYRKAIELKPDYAEAHNNLGNALFGQGQIDASISEYRKAIELKSDFAIAQNNLGTVKDARALNVEVTKSFATGDLVKIVVFLKAMNVTVDDPNDPAKVETAYRDLVSRALDDAVLMKRFDEEAKKVGLIK
jgi:tetratricopeptide (TPR) repeat protein